MSKWLAIAILGFLPFCLLAQSVSGVLKDTVGKVTPYKAVVLVISQKDSVLKDFIRADASGRFQLKGLPRGAYRYTVNYPGYASFSDTFTVKDPASRIDLGTIYIVTRAHLLEEVVVRQRQAAIRMKGDTMIFNADSFRVRPQATVEDMLKVIPGFTIDRRGNITAYGQKVETVLVDGEEFFGPDPTIATRNLNAADIANIQLYDRSTLQATITGIDNGDKKKTVNLILKEDAKKGYFGKVEAGADADRYYRGKINLNDFSSTGKKGLFVTVDKTGKAEMTEIEEQDYGNTIAIYDGNTVRFSTGSDEFSADPEGIATNSMGSAMLNKKYGNGASKNNTINNYTYKNQQVDGVRQGLTTYILPDSVFKQTRNVASASGKFKHQFTTRNEIIVDSTTSLNINARVDWLKGDKAISQNGDYRNSDDQLLNGFSGTSQENYENSHQKIDGFARKRLRKKGRFLTASFALENGDITSGGTLYNLTKYYTNAVLTGSDVTDQRKYSKSGNSAIQFSLGWAEPVSRKGILNLSYIHTNSATDQLIASYDRKVGAVDSLNDLYSGKYRISASSERFGAGWVVTLKTGSLRVNGAVQLLRLTQRDINKNGNDSRLYTNFFPSVNYRTKLNKATNFSVTYAGNMQQPSFSQLQPIVNNTDPLNVFVGNPDLRPSFQHAFTVSVNGFNGVKNRSLSFNGSYTITDHAFSLASEVQPGGQRLNRFVNVSGNYTYNMTFSYDKRFKKSGWWINVVPRVRGTGMRATLIKSKT